MNAPHSHCHRCGHAYEDAKSWPRQCSTCKGEAYLNPLPVTVLIAYDSDGRVVIVNRLDGGIALPGGYLDMQETWEDGKRVIVQETWQEGGARELVQETQLVVDPNTVEHIHTGTSPAGMLVVFGAAPLIDPSAAGVADGTEVSAVELRDAREVADQLKFELHQHALRRFIDIQARRAAR